MGDLYFATDWVIQFVDKFGGTFNHFRNVASELAGDFVVIQPSKMTRDGYEAVGFAIRIPSKDALDLFDNRIGKTSGLTDWQPISEEEFDRGKPSLLPDDPYIGIKMIEGLIESAIANENKRKQDKLNK